MTHTLHASAIPHHGRAGVRMFECVRVHFIVCIGELRWRVSDYLFILF